MKLYASLMAFLDHELHRVPGRAWRSALQACQVCRPGFNFTWVQGVALVTHLNKQCVFAGSLMMIHNLDKGCTLLGWGLVFVWPVYAKIRSYPGTTKLPLRCVLCYTA